MGENLLDTLLMLIGTELDEPATTRLGGGIPQEFLRRDVPSQDPAHLVRGKDEIAGAIHNAYQMPFHPPHFFTETHLLRYIIHEQDNPFDLSLPGERDETVVVDADGHARGAVGHPHASDRLACFDDMLNTPGNIHLLVDHGWKNFFEPVSDGLMEGLLALFQEIAVRREDAQVLGDKKDRRRHGIQEHGVELLMPLRNLSVCRTDRVFHSSI